MATTSVWLALSSSSSTSARNHLRESTRTRTHPCPRTSTRSSAHGWKETNGLARPAQHRRSPRAPGRIPPSPPQSFCMLWRANGEVKQDTATFTSPDSKFGNSNGTLVPEGAANDGMQGTGSWEKSAISARFFLIFSWQAYSNQDGYLVPSNPPPPPPAPSAPTESLSTVQSGDGGLAHLTMQSAPSVPVAETDSSLPGIWGAGQAGSATEIPDVGALSNQGPVQPEMRAHRSSPVHSAIRTAASNLSAAISLAQDMGQTNPMTTHNSLAQSLRVTSDILREVSEELLEVARNQSSSTAPDTAPEAEDYHMERDD